MCKIECSDQGRAGTGAGAGGQGTTARGGGRQGKARRQDIYCRHIILVLLVLTGGNN
jgi:hypothetical protein